MVVSDHLVSHDERVADTLSAGGAAAFLVGASGGFARLGPSARAGREVYDVWRLGTEPEPRYRLEVLFDAYATTTAEALAALEAATERPTSAYAAVCASQPHPQTLRGLGRAGVSAEQLEGTSFVGEIGNLGRPRSGSPWRWASTGPGPATTCWRSATAAARRSPRTSRSPPTRPRSGRPARSPARRSTCRRTTVGPAAARPNRTRRRPMRVGVLGIGKTPHKIQHGKSLRDLVVEAGRGRWPTPAWSRPTSRPSTSATSARSASTTRTRPG